MMPGSEPSVSYDSGAQAVTVVSITGISKVTGGMELSWGGCLLGFGCVWGLIALSAVGVGLWEQLGAGARRDPGRPSVLLLMGLGLLAAGGGLVAAVLLWRRVRARRTRRAAAGGRAGEEGRTVLVDGHSAKKVTV
ncbi:uncharacterized protein [Lepisosteus oculatus]|uniref:uncharacterized protein n=1 Tax=Lepisosteus oculatus TaxID=7918 RepID=UPI00371A2DBF